MQAMTGEQRRKWRKTAMSGTVGAVVGAAAAAGFLVLAETGAIGELSESQVIASLVALVYLLMGIGVGLGVASPRLGAKFLNVEDAEELREERAMLAQSAIGCVLLAVSLAVLAWSGEGSAIPPGVALAVVVGAFAACAWLTAKSLRLADELMRAVMHESASLSFYLTSIVLGGWAALSHLGFAPGPGPLDIVTLIYALQLVAAFWVIGRRGMMMR